MKTIEEQYAFLRFCANGTDFVLDTQRSPKAEFARLAQMKRWVGGDADWQAHWQVCFGETYVYGSRSKYWVGVFGSLGGSRGLDVSSSCEVMF